MLSKCLVAVHLGAGYHSEANAPFYKNLVEEACQSALKILNNKGTALDSVCEAMRILENSPNTNAGIGSNLTICGKVECDASVMDGQTLSFGAVGAISNVKNPILVARKLLLDQNKGQLDLGRIPPCLLAGEGARAYAIENQCEIITENEMIRNETKKEYYKAKKRLEDELNKPNKKVRTDEPSQSYKMEGFKLDTVGAICIDKNGNIASAVSSGGVILKHSGRIGQAASYGAGCWAQNTKDCSIGIATSGGGEYLIRTMLAEKCAKALLENDDPLIAAKECFEKDFVQSPYLKKHELKLAGCLILKLNSENGLCDLIATHTTKSFCYGYIEGKRNSKSVTKISRLTNKDTKLKDMEVQIEALCFRLK